MSDSENYNENDTDGSARNNANANNKQGLILARPGLNTTGGVSSEDTGGGGGGLCEKNLQINALNVGHNNTASTKRSHGTENNNNNIHSTLNAEQIRYYEKNDNHHAGGRCEIINKDHVIPWKYPAVKVTSDHCITISNFPEISDGDCRRIDYDNELLSDASSPVMQPHHRNSFRSDEDEDDECKMNDDEDDDDDDEMDVDVTTSDEERLSWNNNNNNIDDKDDSKYISSKTTQIKSHYINQILKITDNESYPSAKHPSDYEKSVVKTTTTPTRCIRDATNKAESVDRCSALPSTTPPTAVTKACRSRGAYGVTPSAAGAHLRRRSVASGQVLVTDVTCHRITVTFLESNTRDGFFKAQPVN